VTAGEEAAEADLFLEDLNRGMVAIMVVGVEVVAL
jgi:hypothetical protein